MALGLGLHSVTRLILAYIYVCVFMCVRHTELLEISSITVESQFSLSLCYMCMHEMNPQSGSPVYGSLNFNIDQKSFLLEGDAQAGSLCICIPVDGDWHTEELSVAWFYFVWLSQVKPKQRVDVQRMLCIEWKHNVGDQEANCTIHIPHQFSVTRAQIFTPTNLRFSLTVVHTTII